MKVLPFLNKAEDALEDMVEEEKKEASVSGRCKATTAHGDRSVQCTHTHEESCGDGSDCHPHTFG